MKKMGPKRGPEISPNRPIESLRRRLADNMKFH